MTRKYNVQGAEKGHIPGFVTGTGILAGFNLIDGDVLRNILALLYILYVFIGLRIERCNSRKASWA